LIAKSGEHLPPSKFLPAAEHYQLMPAIDRWVIERTLRELSHHASLLQGRMARFSINLSSQSIADPEMAAFIESRFAATGLPPETICFELTETVASHQLERAARFMSAVRQLGCEFALDDFGSGSFSLADLHNLPVSVIKIDGTLVRNALNQPRAESMVGAISQLAKSMDILAVAKNVETSALQIRMESLGVAYGQGFEIGKPVPLSEVLQDLALYEFISKRDQTITAPILVETDLPPSANGT
jgi:EAL domain-containing protein (putative c-di-GMP-specific phosphodiesterase class I)